MDDLIDQIHYDHISMAKILNIMEKEIERIEVDLDPDYDLLVESMRYMIDYSDAVHHPKEDEIFARLQERVPELKDSIQDILQQHKTLAGMSEDFSDIVSNASLGEFVSKQDITKSGHEYIRALRKHMDIEEGDLLRKARSKLTADDMLEVQKLYRNHHDPLVSDSLEYEYNALYRSLINP